MRASRGATLVEAMVSTVMVAGVLVGAATLFGFVASRVAADSTQAAAYGQATALAAELTKTISAAKDCTLQVNGTITGLRCEMPANGTDTDQDGLLDRFTPTSYNYATDTETFATGFYMWYYMSDSAGTWGAFGTKLWRAAPPTNANPAVSDLSTSWVKYYGGAFRWNLIDSVTYTIDTTRKSVTFTISASSYNRAERSAATEPGSSDNAKITITRTVFWRNYR